MTEAVAVRRGRRKAGTPSYGQLLGRLDEAERDVASLREANARLREIAAADRRRAEAAEEATRRAYRVSLHVPDRPGALYPPRLCEREGCGVRFQPARKDQRFCCGDCRVRAWQRAQAAEAGQ